MRNNGCCITIAIIETVIAAPILASILEEKNIPYRIRSFYDTAYDGLFQMQLGWGEIYAPAEYKQEIIEIIN